MSESIWDDADLKTNDDYVKFDNVGDGVTGKIISIRKHTFDDGKVVPQILLDVAGEEKTLTAGQIQLKAKLAELRPGVGDVLSVALSDIEKRSGGKTLKHFTVTVGGAPAAVAAVSAPAVDTQAAAAAIANLSDEQKVALGIAV